MQFLARRSPPFWPLLLAAALFGALAVYGIATGEAYLPPGRSAPARHALQSLNPVEFLGIIRFEFGAAVIFGVLGFVRVTPVEEFFLNLRGRLDTRNQTDRKPAPLWAYAFLAGFIALIVWIGWKVMYSE